MMAEEEQVLQDANDSPNNGNLLDNEDFNPLPMEDEQKP